MSKVIKSALELIGNTPLLQADRYAKKAGVTDANLYVKLEYLNPSGSVKDRIALAMIEDAEEKGELKPGATIIEPTSGNTGIGIAAVATAKGYRAILTLPETMSVERRNLLKAYGAELVLTDGSKGMKGAIAKAEELKESIPGAIILGQFDNPANSEMHKKTTGPEIWEQTEGKVDIFVAGVGTGGTLTGVGEYLKEQNPDIKIVSNAKLFGMLPNFFEVPVADRSVTVAEGQTLSLGSHTLQFFMAPMVHWPEVMVTYEQSEKILFSADAFGKFGTLDTDEDWACEARRYYFNIVGKYGMPAQALLKKAAGLDIQKICALHGPILTENLEYYIGKYQLWSTYTPEDEGIFIAYCSLHGNTEKAAKKLAEILKAKGEKNVVLYDLARDDMPSAIADAYRYDRLVVAAASYDGGIFPCMETFLRKLKAKNFQKRTVGYIQNGTWAPCTAKQMQAIMGELKNITNAEPVVTIKSAMKEADVAQLEALADALMA